MGAVQAVMSSLIVWLDCSSQGWSLLAIFASTILGLVLDPLPVGAWAFLAVTTCVVTKTLTFAQAFAAMTNEIIWLIVVSVFFAKV
jgi:DASS family divalent anion:Na+ symporter